MERVDSVSGFLPSHVLKRSHSVVKETVWGIDYVHSKCIMLHMHIIALWCMYINFTTSCLSMWPNQLAGNLLVCPPALPCPACLCIYTGIKNH